MEPNGHPNQQPVPHQKAQVVQGDNFLQNPHKDHQLLRGVELEMNRENNPHLGPLLEKMVVVEVMVMVMVVMVEMTMMMMMMMKILKQSLKVKMGKIQMHQEEAWRR